MRARHFIFESIKAHLKARNLTYKDLSHELGVSEPTVKRIFSEQDCSLERLESICSVLHLELRDLIKATPRPRKLIQHLTHAQEKEFAKNKKLLMVAICALALWTFEDMVENLTLHRKECVALLHTLENIGFIELHPRYRYKLLVAREFAWIVDGPIMRMVKAMADDYFDHRFDGAGETLKIINVRVSGAARIKLKAKLDQIAQEYADQVSADAHLPLHERRPLSICIAAREWVPAPLKELTKVGKPS